MLGRFLKTASIEDLTYFKLFKKSGSNLITSILLTSPPFPCIFMANKGKKSMIDVFAYSDYRKYLNDFYEAEKRRNPHFSHRYIAQKVGFNSSGFFSKILQGTTNISNELALKFADFCKLKKSEADYFGLLVLYNQAKSHAEKKRWFEKILAFSKSKVKIVEVSQYEFF